ncbi:MAG: hypothetical protein WBE22_06780 [Halobacteriota archaeon]
MTVIWFMVRVPVLSEQVAEVEPRVSTEERRLIMAYFLAMATVPKERTPTNVAAAIISMIRISWFICLVSGVGIAFVSRNILAIWPT